MVKFGYIFSMPGVLHNIYNLCSRDLPNMSALALWCCVPSCSCVHTRQITPAHVTCITCVMENNNVDTCKQIGVTLCLWPDEPAPYNLAKILIYWAQQKDAL